MSRFIYILTDCRRQHLHIGITTDLRKTVDFYRVEATLLFDTAARVSRLVYFEEFNSDEQAQQRFTQVRTYTRMQKERLIRSANSNWHDVSPPLSQVSIRLPRITMLPRAAAS